MGPSGEPLAALSYHRQYEKSATSPRVLLGKTGFPLGGKPPLTGSRLCACPGPNHFAVSGDQARRRAIAFGSPSTQCCASRDCIGALEFALAMSHATFSLSGSWAIAPSPFRAFLSDTRALIGPGSTVMTGLIRAAIVCASLALGLVSAQAADKAFKRDDLADAAIKLEAQIKSEAGPVAKSSASLRTDADAAFRRNDFRSGLQILGQIAATAPDDSGNWQRLARTIFQIKPSNSTEQTFF